jgi:hypothetical protein
MKRLIGYMAVATLALGAASTPVNAQSLSASATMSTTVERTGYINLSANSITFPTPSVSDYEAGFTQPVSVGLSYGSNATIHLGYEFSDASMTGSGGNNIPVGRIQQKVGAGDESAMQQFNSAWRSGISPGTYAETLTFRLQLTWHTAPDTYSAGVTYTLSTS